MSTYYTIACHDCRVQTFLGAYTRQSDEEIHSEWTEKRHKGHNTELADDYNEIFEAKVAGMQIIRITYDGVVTEPLDDPYKKESFNERDYDL
jgi:hypothetical protein